MKRPAPDLLRTWLQLYLVTDTLCCRGRRLCDVVASAVQGGVTCVQLREKELSTRAFIEQARALQDVLAPRSIPLVINDRVDVAVAVGADGVHLGQGDMPVPQARALLPPHVFIGLSVDRLAQVHDAALFDVDYLAVSPVFATATKQDVAPPWGLSGLQQVRRATTKPLVAIGGIHAGNAAQVRAAGADGLAVVSAICGAADPQQAAISLRAATL
jgi:thiamine-phosphate pyrophosphorylase